MFPSPDEIYRQLLGKTTRRNFLKGVALLGASLALGGCTQKQASQLQTTTPQITPTPESTTPEKAKTFPETPEKYTNPAFDFGYPYLPAFKFRDGYNIPLDESGSPIPVSEIECWNEPFFMKDDGSRLNRIYGIETKWVVLDVTDYVDSYPEEAFKKSALIFPENPDKLDLVKPKRLVLKYDYIELTPEQIEKGFPWVKDEEGMAEKVDYFMRLFMGQYTLGPSTRSTTCSIEECHNLPEWVRKLSLKSYYQSTLPLICIQVDDLSKDSIDVVLKNLRERLKQENQSLDRLIADYGTVEKFLRLLEVQHLDASLWFPNECCYSFVSYRPKDLKRGKDFKRGFAFDLRKELMTPRQQELLKSYVHDAFTKLWG